MASRYTTRDIDPIRTWSAQSQLVSSRGILA